MSASRYAKHKQHVFFCQGNIYTADYTEGKQEILLCFFYFPCLSASVLLGRERSAIFCSKTSCSFHSFSFKVSYALQDIFYAVGIDCLFLCLQCDLNVFVFLSYPLLLKQLGSSSLHFPIPPTPSAIFGLC